MVDLGAEHPKGFMAVSHMKFQNIREVRRPARLIDVGEGFIHILDPTLMNNRADKTGLVELWTNKTPIRTEYILQNTKVKISLHIGTLSTTSSARFK